MARKRNGFVLPIVTVISVVVAILGTGMITVAYGARMRALRTVQVTAARVAADNGLTLAIQAIRSRYNAGLFDAQSLPVETDVAVPNFEGTFSYAVADRPEGGYTVTSIGKYQGVERTVEALVQWGGVVHEYGLFARQGLVLGNSVQIDAYNDEGKDRAMKIGTNSTDDGAIVLRMNSCIDGDVAVGPGGDTSRVIRMNGGQYTGSAYAQPERYDAPAVSVPGDLASSLDGGRIEGNRTITSSGKYASIDLGNSEKLVIDGNVELYVTGDILLGNAAEIRINPGSSLVLYVDGDVEGKNGSVFNNLTQVPSRLRLFGTADCSKIVLKNSGDMYAVVYAPSADVTVHNSATVFGSITSRTCDLKNSGLLHYDASLQELQDSSLPPVLKLVRWREY